MRMALRTPLPMMPGTDAPELAAPRPRDLCTDCGISRSRDPGRCGRACQFIHPRYDELERQVHGRPRDPARPDELHFGTFLEMVRARLVPPSMGSQWTGITTRIGARLLETGAVDAVLATASDPLDRWRPRPVIVTEPEGMAACRGMKMGFSPLLALLDEAIERGHRRLAVIGIPCQVHALRALEPELGLERLYVIGTPCSDNTTTENFHTFLDLLSDRPEEVTYLEFLTDFHVELRFRDGSHRKIPFIQLPISQLPADFMPVTCRSCADYTNALADLTVGYMGGDGDQWLLVRNDRGRELVASLGTELSRRPLVQSGNRRGPVRSFLAALLRTSDGLPLRRAPRWARPLIGWMMTRFGPRGLEFARARVEMKAVESVVTLRRNRPRRMARMIPPHVWKLAAPYGLAPGGGERMAQGPRSGAGPGSGARGVSEVPIHRRQEGAS
jgi:coenzyme F420 hydrogenase subunit beta